MSSKIECGFDVIDGKHVPTVKVLLAPCGPDDIAAWDARDLLAKQVKQIIATPVVERQPSAWLDEESGAIATDKLKPLLEGFDVPLFRAPPELAELQAELANTNVRLSNSIEQVDELQATIERLKGGQGEPTAEMEEAGCQAYMKADGKNGAWCLHKSSMGHAYRAMRALELPAPVSVVLPEQCDNKLVSTHYRNGWNACLDKVKELNQ